MKAIELFAGAGGLALGTKAAGFSHEIVIERDRHACATIRENNARGVINWPLFQGDVATYDFSQHLGIDLVAGGPPCQPFSIAGKHNGQQDHRNLFPEAIRAVRECEPKALLIENVKGLTRAAFAKFFGYVILQLTYPELRQRKNDSWQDHLARLERYHTRGKPSGLHYNVVYRRVDAANYGVPQRRERVFIVGFRSDIAANWSFPDPTHSADALLRSKWITGEYWEKHRVPSKFRQFPERLHGKVSRLREPQLFPVKAWLTVRDAIRDLPTPSQTPRPGVLNHVLNPGARAYVGHTGSPLDEPAKTLKAGDHGVPGGENMLALPDGEVRYFTVRESARLQTFPDDYLLCGAWTESMRQLGNAVAVGVASIVAKSIAESLAAHATRNALQSAGQDSPRGEHCQRDSAASN